MYQSSNEFLLVKMIYKILLLSSRQFTDIPIFRLRSKSITDREHFHERNFHNGPIERGLIRCERGIKYLSLRKGGRISLRIFIRLAGFHFREIGILNCILSLRDAEYRTTYLTVLNIPVSRASWLIRGISRSFQIRTVKFASPPPASYP